MLFATWISVPNTPTPEIFAERGQLLFPEFTDPNAAASLEVIEFDPQNATVRPLKVQNRNGRWTIPSQHDYPTDASDRLAKTAAALIALKRDDVASDNMIDHEASGVLDPLDTTLPALVGRGTRLTVRGTGGQLLADVIIGKPVAGKPGFRYVRQPDQRRVYVSSVGDLNPSTAFGDWIDRDLLRVAPSDIDAVNLRNYSLDRATGRAEPGDTLLFQKKGRNSDWELFGLRPQEQINPRALDALLTTLTRLTITGVLPKPSGVSASLSNAARSATLGEQDIADLRRKGFFLTGSGQLVSSRGEIVVRTIRGVFYTLRFGDVAPGSDAPAATGGTTRSSESAPAETENRYMFVMVDFDQSAARTPALGAEGAEMARILRARFAPWYYVIAADSFSTLRARRSSLVSSAK